MAPASRVTDEMTSGTRCVALTTTVCHCCLLPSTPRSCRDAGSVRATEGRGEGHFGSGRRVFALEGFVQNTRRARWMCATVCFVAGRHGNRSLIGIVLHIWSHGRVLVGDQQPSDRFFFFLTIQHSSSPSTFHLSRFSLSLR